ncbi:MAG: nicotinate (nicotinamide) nucleotide adenylyltransferase [Bacteroidetes bacterium]|nr:nicotinate (nicotinamide) nucleotide adenylyltransferase [Bacteroidota bacterium]
MKRLCLYGGTFDPPHIGHLIIAESAREQLELDKVFFVPAYRPPHKKTSKCTRAVDRIAMLQLAIEGNLHFDILDLEIQRKGVSYTVETVREFRKLYPKQTIYFLLGSDNFNTFHTWKEPKRIIELVQLVVYERPGFPCAQPREDCSYVQLKGPFVDISSTQIRTKVANGESIRYLVPERIESYIRRKKLYLKV